jgi:hypothetical protein
MTSPNNISNNNIENNHPPETHSPRQDVSPGKLPTGQDIEVVSSTHPLENTIPLPSTAISNHLWNGQSIPLPSENEGEEFDCEDLVIFANGTVPSSDDEDGYPGWNWSLEAEAGSNETSFEEDGNSEVYNYFSRVLGQTEPEEAVESTEEESELNSQNVNNSAVSDSEEEDSYDSEVDGYSATLFRQTGLEEESQLNSQNVNNSTVSDSEEEDDSYDSEVDGHSTTGLQQISEEQARRGHLEAAFQGIELELEEKFDQASETPLGDVVKFLKGAFIIKLLEEAAVKIVNDRKTGRYPREVDDDKTYLGLIVFSLLSIFKYTFNLPIHNNEYDVLDNLQENEIIPSFDFRFFGYPSFTLTGYELTVTRNEINRSLNDIDRLAAYFIEEEEVWTKRLEEEFAQEKENDPVFKPLRDEMDKLDEEMDAIGSGEYNNRALALRDAANNASSEWLKNKTTELLRKLS